MSVPMKKPKLDYLESLRGIAALIVVLYHGPHIGPLFKNPFVENGAMMVDFFFVLSGFVIAYTYFDKIQSWRDAALFQKRRFFRLYPLHIVTLFAVLVAVELPKYFFQLKGYHFSLPAFSQNSWPTFLSHVLMLQAFGKTTTWNYPSWSISTEFFAYILFAVILSVIAGGRARVAGFGAVFLACLALVVAINPVYSDDTTRLGAFVRCFYCFSLGVLLHQASLKKHVPAFVVYPAFLACVFALYTGLLLPYWLVPMIFGLLILALVHSGDSMLKKVLCHPALVFLGTVSYGIYLCHPIVWMVVVNAILMTILKVPFLHNNEAGVLVGDAWPVFFTVVGCVALTILAAWISYRFLETPFNRLGHKERREV